MRELVLLYNFEGERLRKVKFALMPLKVGIKVVEKEDFSQPIGYLAGIKDIEASKEACSEDGFSDEMLLMCGFTGQRVDMLIRALRKSGVGAIPLKAVITPTNKTWSSIALHNAVRADYEEMKRKAGQTTASQSE
ncbi:MAG: DUF3783 domain-containing protein [Acutalibacteraceae bacterium]